MAITDREYHVPSPVLSERFVQAEVRLSCSPACSTILTSQQPPSMQQPQKTSLMLAWWDLYGTAPEHAFDFWGLHASVLAQHLMAAKILRSIIYRSHYGKYRIEMAYIA